MIKQELSDQAKTGEEEGNRAREIEFVDGWKRRINDAIKTTRKREPLGSKSLTFAQIPSESYMGIRFSQDRFRTVLHELRREMNSALIGFSIIKPWERPWENFSKFAITFSNTLTEGVNIRMFQEELVLFLNNEILCSDRYRADGKRYVEVVLDIDPRFPSLVPDINRINTEIANDRKIEDLEIIDSKIRFKLLETDLGMEQRKKAELERDADPDNIRTLAQFLLKQVVSDMKQHPSQNSWSGSIFAGIRETRGQVLELLKDEIARNLDLNAFSFSVNLENEETDIPMYNLIVTKIDNKIASV